MAIVTLSTISVIPQNRAVGSALTGNDLVCTGDKDAVIFYLVVQ